MSYPSRPRYENEATLAEEEVFKNLFEQSFPNFKLKKNPIQYRMDFSVINSRNKKIEAMIELRCRKYTKRKITELGGLSISLMKWIAALKYWEEFKIPVRFYFRFLDTPKGEYFRLDATREVYEQCSLGWMEMHSRGDKQDCEPTLLIPTQILERRKLSVL